jgi:hypothetical protein
MLYFRFVPNAFVLGVVEVKLWEASRNVKRKQEVRRLQYSLRCIGETDVETRRNAGCLRGAIGGSLLDTCQESEANGRAFDLLRNVSRATRMAAW